MSALFCVEITEILVEGMNRKWESDGPLMGYAFTGLSKTAASFVKTYSFHDASWRLPIHRNH